MGQGKRDSAPRDGRGRRDEKEGGKGRCCGRRRPLRAGACAGATNINMQCRRGVRRHGRLGTRPWRPRTGVVSSHEILLSHTHTRYFSILEVTGYPYQGGVEKGEKGTRA